ncbi:MAG: DsbC family protein [Deltaproteobacteria bacterium]|nr:DsbC family protein [Deltaproteobacteria bacterium]
MSNKITIAVIAGVFFAGTAAWGADLSPEASLKKIFPDMKIESLQPTPIKGVFEVVTDRGLIYYAPEAECLIAGSIITKEGKNITQQRSEEIFKRKEKILLEIAKALPLDKAVKIGTGRHTVIEFTDPNCSYCRKAFQVLAKKEDMTRYIFFFPLSKASSDKVQHILCAADRVGAYKEAFSGQLDKKPLTPPCDSAEVTTLMKIHRDQARRLGIEGTPFFIIDGHIVAGADIPVIEKLLAAPVK